MRRLACWIALTAVLGTFGAAQATSATASSVAPAAAQLTAMLNAFLAGASTNDIAAHDRFWTDDLIYTGSGGRRIGKADIMSDVRAAPAPKPQDPTAVYSAEEIRIQQYGDAAIVAFRLVSTQTEHDSTSVSRYLNTGFFVRRKGEWRVSGWQATRML